MSNSSFYLSAILCLSSLARMTAAESSVPNPTEVKPTMLPRTRQLIAEEKPVRVVLCVDSISEVKKGWNGGAKKEPFAILELCRSRPVDTTGRTCSSRSSFPETGPCVVCRKQKMLKL